MKKLQIPLLAFCVSVFFLLTGIARAQEDAVQNGGGVNDKTAQGADALDELSQEKVPEINAVPYLSTYHIKPTVDVNDSVKLDFYVTDFYQTEWRKDGTKYDFTVVATINGKEYKKTVKSGDNFIELGKLPAGDYDFKLQAIDANGRRSCLLWNEFRVREKASNFSAKDVYVMKPADLEKFKIRNDGDYGTLKLVNTEIQPPPENANQEAKKAHAKAIANKLAEIAKATPAPAKGYLILAADNDKDGLVDFRMWKEGGIVIKYAADYNKDAVEAASLANMQAFNEMLKQLCKEGIRKLVLLPGTYRFSGKDTIDIPSDFTLDMNGAKFKLNEFLGESSMLLRIRDCYDSHVINGTIEGDYFEHDYVNSPKNSEWVSAIIINGESKYCSFENLNVQYFAGYGTCTGGKHQGTPIQGLEAKFFKPGMIKRGSGEEVQSDVRITSDFMKMDKFKDEKFFRVSRYLGYQGIHGTSINLECHFYDAEKKYLGTTDCCQYRPVQLLENTAFVRVTLFEKEYPKDGAPLRLNAIRSIQNCEFKNLNHKYVRCVGMVPSGFYGMLIENCTFTRCGEASATCAFDAEDGWDLMQDMTIRKCKFWNNFNAELLTCCGHNFTIEECEGKITLYSRTAGYCVRNNKFTTASFGYRDRCRTECCRVYNNTFSGTVKVERSEKAQQKDWSVVIRDCVVEGPKAAFIGGTFQNCTFRGHEGYPPISGKLKNCVVENMKGTYLADVKWEGCTVRNIDLGVTGPFMLKDCKVENMKLGMQGACEVSFINSQFKDLSLNFGYYLPPRNLSIEGCKIVNANTQVIRSPIYTTGKFTLKNNEISTGSAPVYVNFDNRKSKAAEDEEKTGYLTLTGNKINTSSPVVLDCGAKGQSVKKIIVTAQDNIFSDNATVLLKLYPNAPWELKGNDPAPEKKNQ